MWHLALSISPLPILLHHLFFFFFFLTEAAPLIMSTTSPQFLCVRVCACPCVRVCLPGEWNPTAHTDLIIKIAHLSSHHISLHFPSPPQSLIDRDPLYLPLSPPCLSISVCSGLNVRLKAYASLCNGKPPPPPFAPVITNLAIIWDHKTSFNQGTG